MPQLDHTTFISQLFWLIVIFSCLYLVTLKYILPTVGQVLKVRKKMLTRANRVLSLYENEQVGGQKGDDGLYNQSFIESRVLLTHFTGASTQWIQTTLKELNHSTLRSLNQAYLSSLGNIRATEWSIKKIIDKD